jgi:hypothetical protein
MQEQMQGLRQAIHVYDGGADVQIIEFYASSGDIFSISALNSFCCEFLFLDPTGTWLENVQSLAIVSPIPQLVLQGQFFRGLTHFPTLSVHSDYPPSRSRQRPSIGFPDFAKFFACEMPVDESADSSNATQLILQNVIFHPALELPLYPYLVMIHFQNVTIGRQFYQLLQATSKLQRLCLENLAFHWDDLKRTNNADFARVEELDEEVLDAREFPELAEESDIILKDLVELKVTGRDSPPFWQHHKDLPWVPDISMPALLRVAFYGVGTLEEPSTVAEPPSPRRRHLAYEAWQLEGIDISDEEDDFLDDLQPDALWSLAVVSKRIQELTITNSTFGDHSLMESLKCLNSLRKLVLCGTEVGDWSIEALALLAPQLRYLDVRSTSVTPRKAAQMVEHLREKGGKLQELLIDDPGPFYDSETSMADFVAYQWMEWIGVLVDWIEGARNRRDSKQPWQPPGWQQQQRIRR